MNNQMTLSKVAIHEEKIKLAKELGLDYGAQRVIAEKAASVNAQVYAVDEIKRLTDMKFKTITMEEIKKKLHVKYADHEEEGTMFVGISISIITILVNTVVHFIAGAPFFNGFAEGIFAIFAGIGIIGYFVGFKVAEVRDQRLDQWEGDIPYGGLLAVKEATEKGLRNFRIFYPAKEKKALKDDPIIVAVGKYGVMAEVFSWDDGKLYD